MKEHGMGAKSYKIFDDLDYLWNTNTMKEHGMGAIFSESETLKFRALIRICKSSCRVLTCVLKSQKVLNQLFHFKALKTLNFLTFF